MKQKGFAPILIVIIIALFAVVGAYYLGSLNKSAVKNQAQPTIQPSITTVTEKPLTSLKPTSKPDETASWKVFSEANSLTFKYPVDYILTYTPESINVQKDPARALLYISILDNPNSLSASQWFDSQPSQIREPIISTHSRSSIKVAGQTAVKLVKQDGSNDFLVILTHDTKGYFVYFGPSSAETIIANQILSTFKFTQ